MGDMVQGESPGPLRLAGHVGLHLVAAPVAQRVAVLPLAPLQAVLPLLPLPILVIVVVLVIVLHAGAPRMLIPGQFCEST